MLRRAGELNGDGEPGPAYPIESVDRALTVILAFEDADALTITEIGRMLGVSRSTAYRLLSALEHRGFVRQDPRSKAFSAGTALLRVGLAAAQRSDVRATLRPLLEQVVDRVGETSHLVVLDVGGAFYIDCVESSRMVRATSRVGSTLPADVSAAGKVLLAHLPPSELEAQLGPSGGGSALRRELALVASRGWALNDGESEPGVRAVAAVAPAERTHAGVDAAVTVAGPSERLDDDRVCEIGATLLQAIAEFTPMRR